MKAVKQITTLGIVGAVAVLAFSSQAQPYYIVGDVINGWSDPGAITINGGPVTYDYTVAGGTAGNYEALKITDGTWNTTWPGNNLVIQLDVTGGNTVYFYTGTFTDGWQPIVNRVGFVDPLTDSYEIAGDFTTPNWDTDPNAQLAAAGNGLYTNTYVIATPGTHSFKFRSHGTWGGLNVGNDFGGANNATITTTDANQPVLFQLDLLNGRWLAGNVVAPVTNQIVFAVNMSVEGFLNKFDPAADQVFASGSFNNWPGTGAGALALTNDPVWDANTNIYYATNIVIGLPYAAYEYKFTCNNPNTGNSGYEPLSQNRTFSLLSSNGVVVLPVVLFGNATLSDYLTAEMTVTFTVNMTNAVSYPDGHVFDPNTDAVFINGTFIAGGWSSWDPISLTMMNNDPVGSAIYTYTAKVPAGSQIGVDYKYGMFYANATNYDNEAPAYSDHIRYIRTSATGSYANATDTFGNQYAEPSFGQLTSASASPGNVSVSWVGRPGVELQVNNDLAGGSWQSVVATDGTNWSAGLSSTNGFMSQTNLPATGDQQFFRLIQAW